MENRLVEDNLRLVHYIVRKFGDLPKETYEDYFQEGCIYLTLAAERFDASKGFTFSTFAANYIYNGIRRYRRECNDDFNGLKVDRGLRDKMSKLSYVAYNNGLDLESKEDKALILDYLGVDDFEIPSVSSLDIEIKGKDDSTASQYEVIPDVSRPFTDDIFDCDLQAYLNFIKPKVSDKVYEIISFSLLEYLTTGITYTQKELAKLLDVSQSYVSRAQTKGLQL
jgi:RNA polymerase sigma factor (sigma-70 family)